MEKFKPLNMKTPAIASYLNYIGVSPKHFRIIRFRCKNLKIELKFAYECILAMSNRPKNRLSLLVKHK
jgi:hypothetical protein